LLLPRLGVLPVGHRNANTVLDLDQIARLSLAAVGLTLLMLSARSSSFNRLLNWRCAPVAAVLAVAVSKAGAYVMLYHCLDVQPPSDIPAFYIPWAQGFEQGGLPYRDIDFQFQPYFGLYLLGAWSLWPDPRTFIVVALACHIAAVWVLRELARPWLERGQTTLLILLLGCDPLWTSSAVMGQDESYVILLSSLTLLALQRGRPGLAGVLLAGQFLATKFVVALQSGPLALAGGRRTVLAAVATLAAGYGLVLWAGLNPLYPITSAPSAVEAITHGNLPYALTLLGIPLHPNLRIYDAMLLLGLVWAFFYVRGHQAMSLDRAVLVGTILLLTWTVLSRKSWYEELFIPFLPILAGRFAPFGKACLAWWGLSILASLNASLWYSMMDFKTFEDRGWSYFAFLDLAQLALKVAILLYLLRRARHHCLLPPMAG
jgi:hypothetical protein